MKTRHTRRRKLRFSSAKAAAPVATVKARHSPGKRRQSRASSARHPNGLPTATWSNIQERFVAAKSLGEITRTTLQFFKEHEELQGFEAGPVFPIYVPASEIYKMKVPRKRRIYDVLHVLEGVGMIKRARWNAARNTKGGYFLYYGNAAMVQRLAEMKSNSGHLMQHFRQSCGSRAASVVEEDSVLVNAFEDQAVVERWPCLVTTTVCFLALLFQQDFQTAVALPGMSDRLIDAKKFIGALVPGSVRTETYHDVHRRMYDVVSVLIGCDLITSDKSIESPLESTDKRHKKKRIRFNYDIFTDLRHPEVLQWGDNAKQETLLVGWLSPIANTFEGHTIVSPPSMCWQKVDSDMNLDVTLQFSPAKNLPETQETVRVQDLFSPLGKEPAVKNEWCDESLTQLGLYDALPRQDQIDWELNKQFKDIYREMWGCYNATADAPKMLPHRFRIGRVDVKLADIECHEVLDDNKAAMTANFFS